MAEFYGFCTDDACPPIKFNFIFIIVPFMIYKQRAKNRIVFENRIDLKSNPFQPIWPNFNKNLRARTPVFLPDLMPIP